MSISYQLADASVSVLLRGLNPHTGRQFSHRETATILSKVAETNPEVLVDHIASFQAKISLLRDYLPEDEPSRSAG